MIAVNAKNACNSGQSKVKENKAEEIKNSPSVPQREEQERKEDSAYLPIPDTPSIQ